MTNAERPLPVPTDITLPFWEAAAQERLVVQRCAHCNKYQFFPRGFCISCLSTDIEWPQCSGKGSIYTFTINRRAGNAFMATRVPYVVAMVELDEGVRLMANIINSPLEQIAIGKPVRVVFERLSDGLALPQFVLDQEAQDD